MYVCIYAHVLEEHRLADLHRIHLSVFNLSVEGQAGGESARARA